MPNQRLGDSFVLQTLVELLDDGLHDEDIRAFIVAAHVVNLSASAALSHHVDRLAMILDIQPVSHLHAVSVNRELLVMLDVIDHQRDQLLRELIRAVVVGAAGDVDRHAVGVVERLNKVIRARL